MQLASSLTSRYRVIAYDRRGAGRSANRPGVAWHSIDDHAADLAELIAAAGPPALVAGSSCGAAVAPVPRAPGASGRRSAATARARRLPGPLRRAGRGRRAVRLLGGDRSAAYFRPTLTALAAALPRASLAIIAGAGHMLHAEAPRAFAEHVDALAAATG
ncbi:MAG: alpha/beta hydrolase [Myxococcales bacterium]|nr:alpha/beta hydrolase [Myxococcales bacterium]